LEADRDKVKQVLLNLLSNAIKYNRPNGTVLFRAEASEKDITLFVQDTGLGIPEESLPHLFQKFFRVREHESRVAGTGLGLSICKQIVQGHGGRIEVKSKIGVGTVFQVVLPRASKVMPKIEEVDNK
jgi:two-component system phosphate regulon sensor histidine kinase PhoR